jgi:hypothetical protein
VNDANIKLLTVSVILAWLTMPPCMAADDMLSRADVSRMFSTSFTQWSLDLKESQEMGEAKIAVDGTYQWTLITIIQIGTRKTTPIYSQGALKRPSKVSISIQEILRESEKTEKLTDDQLLSIVSDLQRNMLPEFSVTTVIDLVGGVSQYHFSIFEAGRYPHIAPAAQQTNGCWQQCIRR